MADIVAVFTDPYTTPFERWAADLTEQLASYNPPSPVDEGSWIVWAEQLCALPALDELGMPDPRGFSSWRDWAAALSQVLW